MTDERKETFQVLRYAGLSEEQADRCVLEASPAEIREQIAWLPYRDGIRNQPAALYCAITEHWRSPLADAPPPWRRHDYAAERLGYSAERLDRMQALHDEVCAALEKLPDAEAMFQVERARAEALRRWPNLNADSKCLPPCIDRVLASQLGIDDRGLPPRLPLKLPALEPLVLAPAQLQLLHDAAVQRTQAVVKET